MFLIPVEVDCYAGYKGEESPRALFWGGRQLIVEQIIDRWYEGGLDPACPPADFFKVLCEDGELILLKRDTEAEQWFLVENFGERYP